MFKSEEHGPVNSKISSTLEFSVPSLLDYHSLAPSEYPKLEIDQH